MWQLMSVALCCFISKTADFSHPFKISLSESPAVTKCVIVLSLTIVDTHLECNLRRINMSIWLLYKDILTRYHSWIQFNLIFSFYLFLYSRYFLASDLLLYVHLLLLIFPSGINARWKQDFLFFIPCLLYNMWTYDLQLQ